MPELPEVQTVVDDLGRAGLAGLRFGACRVHWPRTVSPLGPGEFERTLRGRVIGGIFRRGKYIVIRLDRGALLIHLRMSGRLRLLPGPEPASAHTRLTFALSDGRALHFDDPRKFGRAVLTPDPDAHLQPLGPEPLDPRFTARDLAARIRHRRRPLKPLLLDQTVLAGLGNIYVDEALFEARLHPCRRADTLTEADVETLHAAIRQVLRRAIANQGTTLGRGAVNFYSVSGRRGRNADGLHVFRRHGLPCPRCGTMLERFTLGGRGTHVCPVCQPK